VSLEHSFKLAVVDEAEDLRLVERPLDRAAGERRGQVEQGAGGCGDRNAVVDGDLRGTRKRGVPVHADAVAAHRRLTWHGHVDQRRAAGGPRPPIERQPAPRG
jgi:hypothetical protein